jgi:hypothetical protein
MGLADRQAGVHGPCNLFALTCNIPSDRGVADPRGGCNAPGRLLEVAEARVEWVTVMSLRENTFYATIRVRVGDRVQDVDARPSDALNVALRVNAPIFVVPELFEQGFMLTVEGALTTLEEKLRKDIEEAREPPETVAVAYLSFRSLRRGS